MISHFILKYFFKARRVEVNQGLDLDLRLENLVITGACLSSRKDRVVLYAIRREPSEFGGLVIWSEDGGMSGTLEDGVMCGQQTVSENWEVDSSG